MQLSELGIKKAKSQSKPYKLTDGRGLFLQVMPAGGKLWRWKYRFERKEKLMSLGRYPDVPLAKARELHSEAQRLLASGTDPMAVRKAKKDAFRVETEHSFKAIALLWWEHWKTGKSPRHADVLRRRMEADVYPLIGARPLSEIQAPELLTLVKKIEDRGASDLAKRALQSIGQVFRYAVAHGYGTRNPASEFRPSDVLRPTKKVNLARIEAKDLPELLRAIEVYQGTQVTRLALKLIALTFVRTSELIEAKWREIDFDARRWNIAAERMKMKTPHVVPLSKQAIEVLVLLKKLTGESGSLFPGDRDPAKPMSNNTILKALERMGYKGEMTGHGFRGLASTLLHEWGFPHEHIELQLSHAPRSAVSAAYNHALYLGPRAKMMQHWANFLEQAQRKETIIPIRNHVA